VTSDFTVGNHGSIFLLELHTAEAIERIEEHLPADAYAISDAVIVDHRYMRDIVAGIQADGLVR
jgi:hypothetical protein